MPDSKPIQYRVEDRRPAVRTDERAQVVCALQENPPRIEPKYFYDDLGCAIYGAICQLPEYYPTRTEAGIFRMHRDAIVQAVGRGGQLVDLGAGDCAKARWWMPYLEPRRYVPVDIAAAELERALARLAPDFPGIEMLGVAADFTAGLPLHGVLDGGAATFFYPGSSIGNFDPDTAVAYLARVRRECAARPGSGLLIGVDAKKDAPRLDAAYDDALGVTAAFNRNVLVHLNRRFGFGFDLADFVHRGFYNAAGGRIEMHLESVRDHQVPLGEGASRRFPRGTRIHTENSYKYAPAEFEALLRKAGFDELDRWSDPAADYSVFYAR
jgi:dimethylhistidine N-methyltransferase